MKYMPDRQAFRQYAQVDIFYIIWSLIKLFFAYFLHSFWCNQGKFNFLTWIEIIQIGGKHRKGTILMTCLVLIFVFFFFFLNHQNHILNHQSHTVEKNDLLNFCTSSPPRTDHHSNRKRLCIIEILTSWTW